MRILNVCFVLTLISTLAIAVLSFSLNRVQQENKRITAFVNSAGELSSNFEQSLQMYTENTQEAIAFIDTIRPNNENEYIAFITELETLGQELSLDVDVETLSGNKDTLQFSVEFYGSKRNLMDFLVAIEELTYYVRVDEFSLTELPTEITTSRNASPNIQLILSLYVK
ncbi:MAG: hypothetical protein AAB802_03390 [Patescibacteria group bacterium]